MFTHLIILLCLLSGNVLALTITPTQEGWHGASPADIEAVSQSAASTLLEHLPTGFKLDPVILKNSEEGPIVLFKRGPQQAYRVVVDIQGLHWAQLAYQFSHELCHIVSHYEATPDDENQWFEESLCEAASIHAVKQMSNTWKTHPPYPNWTGYAASLATYYEDILMEPHRYLRPSDSISAWYQREKASLRSNPGQRNKNEVIGTQIYAYFEQHPDRWRSMHYINIGNINNKITLQQYLQDWENNLPTDLKYIAQAIANWFGY